MLKHYWNSALRNLLRSKLFTAINVIGLSISIAVFLALSGYVLYHFSFDKFYADGDRIYRVEYAEFQDGLPVLQTSRSHDRAALLMHEYVPQAEAVTRIYHEKAYVFHEDIRIVDQNMLFADSSFMKVFDINLISGTPDALTPPKAVVISQSQAKAYFGDADPLGKTLYFNEGLPFVVTGVFEDIPKTSSIDFDFLVSWSTIYFYGWGDRDGSFDYPSAHTFIKLHPHATNIAAVNAGLARMTKEQITSLEKRRHTGTYSLRPYTELHTAAGLAGEIKPGINKTLLYSLLSLAIFILVAAWINYINLSLARSIERADEIGVRKVFGASRIIISGQFLLEAFMLSCLTFFFGFGLYYLFSGPFSYLIFADVTFSSPGLTTWILYFVGFVVATTLVAFYPAHFISRYKPAVILKNKLGSGRGNVNILHQGLMVFQLFLAVAIVGITFIAGKQMAFLRDFDSGFNAQQTISLRGPASTNSDSLRYSRYVAFRNEVLQNAAFTSGTASMNIPGEEIRYHDEDVHAVGSSNLKKQSFQVMWIDEGYQETFGLTLLGGRNFNPKETGLTCMINESAAKALGYENPVDAVNTTLINSDHQNVTILGVWKDYHQQSLRKSVEPILFYHRHPHEYGYYSFQAVSREGNYLETIEKIWNKHYPNDTFNYYFMDRFFEAQYKSDQLFAKLLNLFSVISITVACLGLFGMASLSMVKRMKEIGVRKVLGASVMNILVMLSRQYIRLILISCVFAFPTAYYLTHQWLSGFAYKIDISVWMIILPGVIVFIATLLTVSSQAIRAALTNPTRILRDQ